jgi:hypothetical protein
MGAKRIPYKTGRPRVICVIQLLLQPFGEQGGKLVFEPLALFIGKRHVARIGASSQHLGIDELDRKIAPLIYLRTRFGPAEQPSIATGSAQAPPRALRAAASSLPIIAELLDIQLSPDELI